MKPFYLALLSTAVLLYSCSDCGDDSPSANNTLAMRRVMPTVTDALITTHNTKPHTVYYHPQADTKNRLLVFLPDAGTPPLESALFGTRAAMLGYHSIGLNYAAAELDAVASDQSATAFADARLEVVTGVDHSQHVQVNESESILNRLTKLLVYLDEKYPDENWGQYLNGAVPDFSKISLCGHEEGAGYAAFMARQYSVDKLLCFSLPHDYSVNSNTSAGWLNSEGWATTPDKVFVLAHQTEMDEQHPVWEMMDVPGTATYIDHDAGYNNAQRLVSNSAIISDASEVLIADASTPMVNGEPYYAPLWDYLLQD